MKNLCKWIIITSMLMMCGGIAKAGSLWAKAGARTQVLYSDDTARKIGDNLTIAINERGVIKNETTRGLDRKSARTATVTGPLNLLKVADGATGKAFNLPNANLNAQSETKFDGDANFNSDRSLVDQITVTVVDVMPNGNLVVMGKRARDVEGDKQTIEVSGIVRVSDINFSNTVGSEKVAEFNIVCKHSGMENRFTKPTWFDQILNIICPF